jgi:phenylacetic acid degradation operon negative regulatory protein
MRPDNLVGGVERARERLFALDPTLADAGAIVAGLSDLDRQTEQRALTLWNSQEAVRAYEHSRRRLHESEAGLSQYSPEEAMVETFLLGGQVLRQVALDPLLPDEIVPAANRASLVTAMRHYDELGRACWAGFLERFDVPHMRAPADIRVADAPLYAAPAIDARTQAETGGTA